MIEYCRNRLNRISNRRTYPMNQIEHHRCITNVMDVWAQVLDFHLDDQQSLFDQFMHFLLTENSLSDKIREE